MDREVEREGVCFRERKKNTVCTTTRAIEEEEELAEDRLSNLPDALIHHIFSFIDTKFTVQTCVLSKRFKDLWTSLPNLNFDTHHFSRFPLFTKFVSQVLSRRDSSTVSTLNFSRSNFVEPRLMKLVINYAIRHNVRQLNIMVSSRRELPSIALLFNCKSLTNLKLYFGEYQNVPNSLNLPAIITLHLRGVSFSNDKSKCLELFSNCLNLKNLTLIDCCTRGLDVFTIYSHQLVNLTIGYSSWRVNVNCKFLVSAPKLSSLQLYGFPPLELSVDDLPSLETVECAAYSTNGLCACSSEHKQMLALRLINVLQALGNAKFVTLNPDIIEILSMVPSLLEHRTSPFANLKSLKIRSTTSIILNHVMAYLPIKKKKNHVMTYLLDHSPSAAVVVEFKEDWVL